MKDMKTAKWLKERLAGKDHGHRSSLPSSHCDSLVRDIKAWLECQGLGMCLCWSYDSEFQIFESVNEFRLAVRGQSFTTVVVQRTYQFNPYETDWNGQLERIREMLTRDLKLNEEEYVMTIAK